MTSGPISYINNKEKRPTTVPPPASQIIKFWLGRNLCKSVKWAQCTAAASGSLFDLENHASKLEYRRIIDIPLRYDPKPLPPVTITCAR